MGVCTMGEIQAAGRKEMSEARCCGLLLMLFLTGLALGCGLVQRLGLAIRLLPGYAVLGCDLSQMRLVLLLHAKFLLVIYLLAFCPRGALLLPPLFGAEGVLLGMVLGAAGAGGGVKAVIGVCLLLLFRLVLVLPYGFLLGRWAMGQSLSFGQFRDRDALGVLLLTAAWILGAAVLECSLGRWLLAVYYLRFGA